MAVLFNQAVNKEINSPFAASPCLRDIRQGLSVCLRFIKWVL